MGMEANDEGGPQGGTQVRQAAIIAASGRYDHSHEKGQKSKSVEPNMWFCGCYYLMLDNERNGS